MSRFSEGDMIYNKELKTDFTDTSYCYYIFSIDEPRIEDIDKDKSVLLQSLYGNMTVVHTSLDYLENINTIDKYFVTIEKDSDLYNICNDYFETHKSELSTRHLDLYSAGMDDPWKINILVDDLKYDIEDNNIVHIHGVHASVYANEILLPFTTIVPEGLVCLVSIYEEREDDDTILIPCTSFIYNSNISRISSPIEIYKENSKYSFTLLLMNKSINIPVIIGGNRL